MNVSRGTPEPTNASGVTTKGFPHFGGKCSRSWPVAFCKLCGFGSLLPVICGLLAGKMLGSVLVAGLGPAVEWIAGPRQMVPRGSAGYSDTGDVDL